MNEPKVSIIIPVYNVEEYLEECLDSVVGQTLREIEIICINDASTDESLAVLKRYSALDRRIRVIDRPVNKGISAARNDGITAATGIYLMFVDSDDFIDLDLCRKAYEYARNSEADLLIYDYVGFCSKEKINVDISKPSQLIGLAGTKKVAILSIYGYAWTKFIRTEHLRTIGLRFPVGMYYEDVPFHWELVICTEKMALLSERLYFYRQHRDSVGYQTDWSRADSILGYDLIYLFLRKKGLYQEYKEIFIRDRIEAFRVLYDSIDRRYRADVLKMIKERMDYDHWAYARNNDSIDWKTRDYYLNLSGSKTAKFRRSVWLACRIIFRFTKKILSVFNNKRKNI